MVYQDQETGYLTQVPVFVHMLEQCGYPGIKELSEDLNFGFATVGPLHRGTGWLPRCDGKYSDPLPLDVFERTNQTYLHQKLRQGFVDEHRQVMLEELLADRAQGRLEGPFRAPSEWPIPSAGIPGETLLPAPTGRVCAAVCFSVCQSDKIRRCEDYRRSFHNATISAPDVPHHDDISVYVQLSKWWRQSTSEEIGIWAHDLDAAYRQLGVRDTSFAYVVLITPGGPLLFRHTALCFGSSASVWSFNRMADAMVYLAHRLLVCPCVHYVDDFGSVEPQRTATSGFWAFSELFRILGLKMKQKKAMAPSSSQRMLGVIVKIHQDSIELEACPVRVQKLQETISLCLSTNQLSPEVAHRLAGKLLFLQTTCFGQMGKAAIQCIYARASQGASDFKKLTGAVEASLLTLRQILTSMTPQVISVCASTRSAVLCTDAFFLAGDLMKQSLLKSKWERQQVVKMENGWGFVMALPEYICFAHGQVPAPVVRRFGRRRAYIYFLEAITPIIATVLMRGQCPKFLLVFVDNQASLQALRKGYGRDTSVNGLWCFFWSLVAKLQLLLHFEWVQSELNIAVPISRHHTEVATTHHWLEIDMDLRPLYKIISRCAVDLQYAAHQAVDDCFSFQAAFRSGLVQGGIQSPRWLDSGHHESRWLNDTNRISSRPYGLSDQKGSGCLRSSHFKKAWKHRMRNMLGCHNMWLETCLDWDFAFDVRCWCHELKVELVVCELWCSKEERHFVFPVLHPPLNLQFFETVKYRGLCCIQLVGWTVAIMNPGHWMTPTGSHRTLMAYQIKKGADACTRTTSRRHESIEWETCCILNEVTY